MKTLITTLVSLVLVSCMSNPYEVKKVDEAVGEAKGTTSRGIIYLNSNNEAEVREEENAADDLRMTTAVNFQLEDELSYVATKLKSCRTDMSDKRLGGDGVIPKVIEIDNMKTPETIKEEFGIAKGGELVVIKKSKFLDAVKNARQYKNTLKAMIKTYTRYNEECEYSMAEARRKAGLPAHKYQGKGYFKDGVWVQTSPHEMTLDDAFEIQAKEKSKAKSSNSQAANDDGDPRKQYDEYGNRK